MLYCLIKPIVETNGYGSQASDGYQSTDGGATLEFDLPVKRAVA